MSKDSLAKLDGLAAPANYVASFTERDISYRIHFRAVCKRYNIDFVYPDSDERAFVIHMAEKEFYQQRA